MHLDFGQHALLDRVQVVLAELDIFELHALNDDHRIVLQRRRDGVLDRGIERAALLNGLDRGIAPEHDFDLLVHHRAHHLVDRGVEPAEFCVEVRDLVGRGAQRDADLQISRLLIVGVGVHLVPAIGDGLDADFFDGVDERHLEAQARLRGADHGAGAQQDAALGLIDRVPAAQYNSENDKARDSGANDSPVHLVLLTFGRFSNTSRGLTIIDDRSATGCDLSHSVGDCGDLVQAG